MLRSACCFCLIIIFLTENSNFFRHIRLRRTKIENILCFQSNKICNFMENAELKIRRDKKLQKSLRLLQKNQFVATICFEEIVMLFAAF